MNVYEDIAINTIKERNKRKTDFTKRRIKIPKTKSVTKKGTHLWKRRSLSREKDQIVRGGCLKRVLWRHLIADSYGLTFEKRFQINIS